MNDKKCDACGRLIRKGGRAKYCSLPCRARGRRFQIAYSKNHLVFDIMKNRMECEALEKKIAKVYNESMTESKKLSEIGEISDALTTLNEGWNNLVRLAGKRQGLHRKTCDLYDMYLDLRQQHGMFNKNDKRGDAV